MKLQGNKVYVKDDNVDRALRQFKKKVADSGLLQDLQERQSFIKPTIKRKLAKKQAKRRWQKYLRDQELPKKMY
jgi:ribosomal protein S21